MKLKTSQEQKVPQGKGSSLEQAIRRTRGGRKRWPWIAVAVIALLLVAGLGFGRAGGQPDAEAIFRTASVELATVTLNVTATGNLEPINQVTVGSELSGTVSEVLVEANDQVTQGQVLARLETSTRENELKALRAAVQASEARVLQSLASRKQASAELERYQVLDEESGGRLPSSSVLQSAETAAENADAEVASARASLAQAQAQLDASESNLAKAELRSPTDGVVLSRSVDAGQTVAASLSAPELFVIAEDLRRMKLEVAVAEVDIARLEQGQQATFKVDAWPDRSFAASVTLVAFGYTVVDNVVSYIVELEVDNSEFLLRPGMTATASIEVAEHANVLTVPPTALRFTPSQPEEAKTSSGGGIVDKLMTRPPRGTRSAKSGTGTASASTGKQIWVLRDNRPQPLSVETGLSDGSRTEVSSPELQAGDKVITGQTGSAS